MPVAVATARHRRRRPSRNNSPAPLSTAPMVLIAVRRLSRSGIARITRRRRDERPATKKASVAKNTSSSPSAGRQAAKEGREPFRLAAERQGARFPCRAASETAHFSDWRAAAGSGRSWRSTSSAIFGAWEMKAVKGSIRALIKMLLTAIAAPTTHNPETIGLRPKRVSLSLIRDRIVPTRIAATIGTTRSSTQS